MLKAGILTVSDTRDLKADTSGQYLAHILTAQKQAEITQRLIVKDDILEIQHAFTALALLPNDLILTNGGTGIARRDVTVDALTPLLVETIPGFGELFRQLSYEDIGTHALASRAVAGFTLRQQLVFILPGAKGANQLALKKIILPELEHLIFERHK